MVGVVVLSCASECGYGVCACRYEERALEIDPAHVPALVSVRGGLRFMI